MKNVPFLVILATIFGQTVSQKDCRVEQYSTFCGDPSQYGVVCDFVYLPVCAKDEKDGQKIFPNNCALCTELKAKTSFSVCKDCEKLQIVKPIELPSGCEDKTFSDYCGDASKYSGMCTMPYAPVCIKDEKGLQKEFSNKCWLCTSLKDKPKFSLCKTCDTQKTGFEFPNPPIRFRGFCKRQAYKDVCGDPAQYGGICTDENAPVCIQGKKRRQRKFSNKCELCTQLKDKSTISLCTQCRSDNKFEKNWKPFQLSGCKEHEYKTFCGDATQYSGVCTEEYAPLCFKDETGKTSNFSNKCTLCTRLKDKLNFNLCAPSDCGLEKPVVPLALPKWEDQDYKSFCGDATQYSGVCTEEDAPICTKDEKGLEREFSNNCQLCTRLKDKLKFSVRRGTCK